MTFLEQLDKLIVGKTKGDLIAVMPEEDFRVVSLITEYGGTLANSTHYGKMREDARLWAFMGTHAELIRDALQKSAIYFKDDVEFGSGLSEKYFKNYHDARNALKALDEAVK